MDPLPSLWTIGWGTITISAGSAIATGTYSVYKNKPQPGFLVAAAAMNSGLTAATFFSARELVVSPFLTYFAPWIEYTRRRQSLGIEDDSTTLPQLGWPELRRNKLLDSGVSGAFAGGLLRGLNSGRPAVLSGSVTGAAVCTLLQYVCNEAGIARLRYLSTRARAEEDNTTVQTPAFKPRYQGVSEVASMRSQSSVFDQLLKLFGVVSISDEEFLEKMKASRDLYLRRIADLERQIEEEKLVKELTRKP